MKDFKIILLLVLFATVLSFVQAGIRIRPKYACEGHTARLSCPVGYEISIMRAMYGRTNRRTCRHSLMRATNCKSSRSLAVVKRACNRKRSCAVAATNRNFGDPCFGTYKYLFILYFCRRRSISYHSLSICEHGSRRFRCPRGRVMNVLYANYGRLNRRTCRSSSIRTTNCRARSSLSKVRASCQGKSTCVLRASNRVFGDPCYGTFKYLHVRIMCYRPVYNPRIVNICEGGHGNLACPHGKSIRILYAMYGRTRVTTCYRAWLVRTLNCRAHGAITKVRSKCQYKRTCSLFASNSVFGDPCYGTYKYLTVRYRCV